MSMPNRFALESKCVICGDVDPICGFCYDCNKCWDCIDEKCDVSKQEGVTDGKD